MNQENKEVKSNEVCYLCLHKECVCKEEWSGMHSLVSNLAIMEAVEHLYPPSFFTEQSLEEKLECKNPCENKNCEIHSLEGNKHNPYLCHPPTDSNWEEEFIEKGADLEHQRWAKWQKYMHSKILPSAYDEIMEIGTELINHWNRQINTPYSELTEKEKESDRAEVKQYLPLIRNLIQLEREKEREKTIKMLSDMKPILYHEDKNRQLENVAVYNFIDKVIKLI